MNDNNVRTAIQDFLINKEYNKLSLKAVLFDMDGVLYDSMPNHARAWVTTMKSYGYIMTEEECFLHEGRTGDDTINIIAKREGIVIDPKDRELMYKKKTDVFNTLSVTLPMKGSWELLQKVTEEGLFAMLVTGSGQPTLLDNLNNNFPGIFTRERMITSHDVKKGKPNPEPYLNAISKGNLKPNEAIVVENAPLGVEAAHAAGLFVVAVNTGPLPDSVLLDAGADILFPSVEALYNEWDNFYSLINGTHCK